jgi:hypothetical protein
MPYNAYTTDASGIYAYAPSTGITRINIVPSSPYGAQDDDEEEALTPVKPSAKALGKRPAAAVDDPEGRLRFYVNAPV